MSPRKPIPYEIKTLELKRIHEILEGKNFKEIANESGFTATQVASYMKGKCKLSRKFIEYVASVGGDIHEILTGEESIKAPALNGISDVERATLILCQRLVCILLDKQGQLLSGDLDADSCLSDLKLLQEAFVAQAS